MSWQTDPSHTSIGFMARHMMLSKVRGEFQDFTIDFNLDEERPETASVEARIKTASIFTKDAQRDAHLKGADFFNAELFPEMVFKSKHIDITRKDHACVEGELTIRDVTKPIVLDVTYLGTSKSPWGATSVGFEASTKINREDWGLTWNVALGSGGGVRGRGVGIAGGGGAVRQA